MIYAPINDIFGQKFHQHPFGHMDWKAKDIYAVLNFTHWRICNFVYTFQKWPHEKPYLSSLSFIPCIELRSFRSAFASRIMTNIRFTSDITTFENVIISIKVSKVTQKYILCYVRHVHAKCKKAANKWFLYTKWTIMRYLKFCNNVILPVNN